MRPPRSLALTVAFGVLCAGIAAGVTYALVRSDGGSAHAAAAPIVLVGVLMDGSGKPVANATIQMAASDDANAKVGDTIPVIRLASGHTDSAGHFRVRQSQSVPLIRKLAAENDGWVNFEVQISSRTGFMPWYVPRKIGPHGWIADESPTVPAALKRERITFKGF